MAEVHIPHAVIKGAAKTQPDVMSVVPIRVRLDNELAFNISGAVGVLRPYWHSDDEHGREQFCEVKRTSCCSVLTPYLFPATSFWVAIYALGSKGQHSSLML